MSERVILRRPLTAINPSRLWRVDLLPRDPTPGSGRTIGYVRDAVDTGREVGEVPPPARRRWEAILSFPAARRRYLRAWSTLNAAVEEICAEATQTGADLL